MLARCLRPDAMTVPTLVRRKRFHHPTQRPTGIGPWAAYWHMNGLSRRDSSRGAGLDAMCKTVSAFLRTDHGTLFAAISIHAVQPRCGVTITVMLRPCRQPGTCRDLDLSKLTF